MKTKLAPGKYVVAVSGGVDSMALLDLLIKQSTLGSSPLELVVAHFNHGIRADSDVDERLVRTVANKRGLMFELGYGHLGAGASEAKARTARYTFLGKVRQKHRALTIITAHHQDDLIETVILNILRGTGRRGVSAISGNPDVARPLLGYSKKQIKNYATKNKLKWHEDISNQDQRYLRNYVRLQLVPRLTSESRQQLLQNADNVAKTGIKIDNLIATLSHTISDKNIINRYKFTMLPTEIGQEVLMIWLRQAGFKQVDKKTIEKLNTTIKTARPTTTYPINSQLELYFDSKFAHLRAI